jgi:hypothetical protein
MRFSVQPNGPLTVGLVMARLDELLLLAVGLS